MKTVIGRIWRSLLWLPTVAGAEESQSQVISLPAVTIDYSGVAEGIFQNQLVLLGGSILVAAGVLMAIRMLMNSTSPGAVQATKSTAMVTTDRVWGLVYLLLLGSLAVVGMRVWLLLQG